MKRFLISLTALLLILCCGCTDAENETEPLISGTDAVIDELSPEETESHETTAPKKEIVLSPEKQAELKHFIPNDWAEGMEELINDMPTDFMFAIQTDTHFSVTSGKSVANNLKALSHYIPLSFYANLGDYIKGYYQGETGKEENTPDKTMSSLKEITSRYLDDANCPVLVTFGNHDSNQLWCKNYGTANEQLTKSDHYEQVISKLKAHNGENMVNDGESNYYYMDFPADNVRVIMLNTTDGSYEDSFDSVSIIGDRQLEWFKTEALNTSANVIIMCHIPLCNDFPQSSGSKPQNADNVRLAVE